MNEAGLKIPVLIHPTAFVSPSARISEGTIVCAKAAVNTNSVVEKGCIISICALADHNSRVGECSHINAGAIVKAGCVVDKLIKVNTGIVYCGE